MDPLTQGLIGAVAAHVAVGRKLPRAAALVGFAGGLLPDIDVFIVNPSDPVFSFVYHRHFTHSLLFIPLGGLIAALPFLFARRWAQHRLWVLLAGLTGVATHGLLDACTSYGTLLLWPFSNHRIAWDILPIIDLFLTPVLLVGIVAAVLSRRVLPSALALAIALSYTGAGVVQHQRAVSAQQQIAEARGHVIERGRVLPSPGTLVLWRSVYESGGTLYADGLRTPYFRPVLARTGTSAPIARLDDVAGINPDATETERIFETFAWFADGFVAKVSGAEGAVVGDMRYSAASYGFYPLWGILFGEEGITRWSPSARGDYAQRLWSMLVRGDPEAVPLADAVARELAQK